MVRCVIVVWCVQVFCEKDNTSFTHHRLLLSPSEQTRLYGKHKTDASATHCGPGLLMQVLPPFAASFCCLALLPCLCCLLFLLPRSAALLCYLAFAVSFFAASLCCLIPLHCSMFIVLDVAVLYLITTVLCSCCSHTVAAVVLTLLLLFSRCCCCSHAVAVLTLLLRQVVQLLLRLPKDSVYSFWLAACVHKWVQASTAVEQEFVATVSGWMEFVVRQIIQSDEQCFTMYVLSCTRSQCTWS